MLSADAYGAPRGENYLHAGGEALPASRAECDGNAS